MAHKKGFHKPCYINQWYNSEVVIEGRNKFIDRASSLITFLHCLNEVFPSIVQVSQYKFIKSSRNKIVWLIGNMRWIT